MVIVVAVVILTSLSFLLGIIIVLVTSIYEKKDERFEEVLKRLPGFNCGSCGYAGCADMARHILEEKEVYKKCRPLRGDKLEEMEKFLENEKI